ncbi:MAG TPA: tetratricopeptide repeat protein, partial [Rhodothermales bacterium]
ERFEEAVSHYRRAAELDPNPVSLQGLANAYWEIGERDSTVQILARAIEVDDSYAPIHFSLSAIAEELQDLDKARRHIHDAVALDSTNVDYQLSAGVIDYKLALYDEARDHLQQVLAAEPMNHTALYNYGQALQRSGQREEGARYLELAETAREQDRALALLRQAVANNPTNAQNQLALARTLHGIGRLDEALRAYKAADLLSPGNAQIRHAIATLHLERGDLEEAIRRYRSIIATDTLPEAWLNLGLAYARMDSLERAHAVWREAGKRFPDHPAVVQVLERIGD